MADIIYTNLWANFSYISLPFDVRIETRLSGHDLVDTS